MSWSPSEAETSSSPTGAEPDAVELTLPELGSGPSATIVDWSKRIGDWVASDESICRLAVGEQQFDVHSTAEGKLQRVFATVGARVVSGDTLAEVNAATGAAPIAEPAPAEPDAEVEPAPAAGPPPAPAPEDPVASPQPFYVTEPPTPLAEPELDPDPGEAAERAPVIAPAAEAEAGEHELDADGVASSGLAVDWSRWHSPVVRKLAEQHGIDLSTVTGTGAGGRIRKRDVLNRI